MITTTLLDVTLFGLSWALGAGGLVRWVLTARLTALRARHAREVAALEDRLVIAERYREYALRERDAQLLRLRGQVRHLEAKLRKTESERILARPFVARN